MKYYWNIFRRIDIPGILATYVSTIIFYALGWITSEKISFQFSQVMIPLAVTCIIWITLRLGYELLKAIILIMASCPLSLLGLILAPMAVGYVVLTLSKYVLPLGWVIFESVSLNLFLMGGTYLLILILANPTARLRVVSKPPEALDK